MEPTQKRAQFTCEELRQNNWWVTGAKMRGGMEVLGTDPQGELLYSHPEKLALPKAVWVTKWGVAVDGWVFLGFGVVSQTGLERVCAWVSAWAAERKNLKPVALELVEELEYRVKHLADDASTRDSRAFLFT